MRALFGCGTPKGASGASKAFLFVVQTDVALVIALTVDSTAKGPCSSSFLPLKAPAARHTDGYKTDFATELLAMLRALSAPFRFLGGCGTVGAGDLRVRGFGFSSAIILSTIPWGAGDPMSAA